MTRTINTLSQVHNWELSMEQKFIRAGCLNGTYKIISRIINAIEKKISNRIPLRVGEAPAQS